MFGASSGLRCVVAQHPVDQAQQAKGVAGGEGQVRAFHAEASSLESLQIPRVERLQRDGWRLAQTPAHEPAPHLAVHLDRSRLPQSAGRALVGEPLLEGIEQAPLRRDFVKKGEGRHRI